MPVKAALWAAIQLMGLGLCCGAIWEMFATGLFDSGFAALVMLMAIVGQGWRIYQLEQHLGIRP